MNFSGNRVEPEDLRAERAAETGESAAEREGEGEYRGR
jgi:hypothetical protein